MFFITIKSRRDFEKAYKNKDEVYHTSSIILFRNPTEEKNIKTKKDFVRIGFTVSKKISKKAVERNYIKRRLREAVKNISSNLFQNHMDYVIVARKNILNKSFSDIIKNISLCLEKKSNVGEPIKYK